MADPRSSSPPRILGVGYTLRKSGPPFPANPGDVEGAVPPKCIGSFVALLGGYPTQLQQSQSAIVRETCTNTGPSALCQGPGGGNPTVLPNVYVSTDCRNEDHTSCQEQPVVRCFCECHTGRWPWVERRTRANGTGAHSLRRRRGDW